MTGTLMNMATVIAGTILGMALKRRMPERMSGAVMQGLAFTKSWG